MPSNTQQVETILKLDVDYQEGIKSVGAYLAEIKKLKTEQSDLNKALKDGTISEQEYGNAMAKNKAVTTQLNSEMKVLTTEMKKKLEADRAETKQIDINTASYNKLSQTYSQMKKKINEMSAAERQQNKAYIDQSKQVYERMKTLQAETGKMQLNVGNYQSAITGLITGNSKFASSLMGLTSGAQGLSGMFASLGNAAKAFGQTLMTLMSNPAFMAIAGIAGAGMAFKFWKDYNDGLAEASRLTEQFTGMTGSAMAGIRDGVQATADVYGKDFKETLQGVDTLVAQFGISWQEANDIINKGFAAGADLNGDMLQQIQQYGPALRDAGLGAEELVAVIQQTRSGIFGKDGLDVIQKAGKNLRDMSKGTAEALAGVGINADEMKRKLADGSITMMQAIQQVSGALKTVSGNSQEAGAIISDVFGRKGVAAGQEQLKALEDLNMSLDSLIESEGEYGKVQQEMVEVQQELNTYTAELFGMDGWDVMKKKAELLVKKGLLLIVKGVVSIINYFIDWYNHSRLVVGIVQTIIAVFKTGWDVIKLVFSLIMEATKSVANVLKGLGDIVEGVFTLSWDKISGGWETIKNGFATSWKNISASFSGFGASAAGNFIDGWNKTMAGGNLQHITANVGGFGDAGGGSMETATGGSGGSGGSLSGGGKSGKSGKTNADKAAAKAAEEEKKLLEEQRKAAEKAAALQRKAAEEELALRQRLIKSRLDIIKKGTQEELDLQLQAIDAEEEAAKFKLANETMAEETRQELLLNLEKQYQKKRQELNEQFMQAQEDAIIQATQNEFARRLQGVRDDELEQLRIRLEQIQYMKDRARQKDGESAEAFSARMIQLENDEYEAKKAIADKEIALQAAKAQALGQMMGAIGDMFEQLGQDNRDALIVAKVLAIAEVAIQQGVAIANAIRAAAEGSHSVWALVAQIAVGVATVTASITQAISAINSAKFARGGLITGPGTGTSDSISAQVSNGESVMTANATAMFSPLLSAINQLGGGVPIHHGGSGTQLGEDMLAAAIAKGYALAPAPVVSVQEISDVTNRVQVIEQLSRS